MDSIILGPWAIHYDAAATRDADATIALSDATVCSCVGCRNFRLAQEQGSALPPELLALLQRFGIAPEYPAEVYMQGSHGRGDWRYDGWFHFVGTVATGEVEVPPTSPELHCEGELLVWPGADTGCGGWFTSRCALVPPALNGMPSVQMEFVVDVPWLLDVPNPLFADG